MNPDQDFTPSRTTRNIKSVSLGLVPAIVVSFVVGGFLLHPGAGLIALGLLWREASIILTQVHARRVQAEYNAHVNQISEQYIRAQAEAKAQHDERAARGDHYGSIPTPRTRNPFIGAK